MASLGEVDFNVTLGSVQMRVRALIMKNLQAQCFGGTTFHADNDIETRIRAGTVKIHGRFLIQQSNPHEVSEIFPPPAEQVSPPASSSPPIATHATGTKPANPVSDICNLHAISLPFDAVTYPSDVLPIPLPSNAVNVSHVSISPSFPLAYENEQWKPQICEVLNGLALYENTSDAPLLAKKHCHFKPHLVTVNNLHDVSHARDNVDRKHLRALTPMKSPLPSDIHQSCDLELLKLIKINTEALTSSELASIQSINKRYSKVFNNDLTGGYNHFSGKFFADFAFSSKPPPTKVFVPQYNKKCADLQQSKCDELEQQGVLVDPKHYNIPILHVSPSWIQQKARAKNKNLQDCSLDELRFITAFNSLNDSIRPKPTSSCSAVAIFLFLAKWNYHVFADLNNSYFQLPVKQSLWSYLGIMTPHKGIRVMTRTGQGLLGSDVELEQLLSRVLGDEIHQGFCMAIRDDIVIGGNTTSEVIANYESVLKKLYDNNLKLSPNKVRILPVDTEIYGYRILNGCVQPSDHTVTTLGRSKIEDLKTVKQVNSWRGLYKTLIGHLPALSNIMSPFDTATIGKNSNEKFLWTPTLTAAFNRAMSHLSKVNKTYLPKPSEQLILLPDAMSTSPCVGWVLYVQREGKLLPVTHCTAKLKDYMTKWYPCEKEAVGVVLSLEQCAHWIGESTLTTLVGPDSLAVVKAVNLIRRGKHSSNPRLQSLLASVNRRNIAFFHNSAKAGRHIVPDHLSRMTDSTCRAKDCAIERFLDDIPVKLEAMAIDLNHPSTDLLSITLDTFLPPPPVLAATAVELEEQLLARSGPIPLGSHQTWINIQKTDEDCKTVFRLKTLGEEPRKKNTNPNINRIFKESSIHQGLLVVKAFDNRKFKEIHKVVVPPTYMDSILTVLHVRLNHPKQSQLKLLFDRYFFSPRTEAALVKLYSSCHLCAALKKFPKGLETFSPTFHPEHPGVAMNIDVMKRAGQMILVNVDIFSFYVTACFTPSEKAEDLAVAIIQSVTPIRRSDSILVRVDKAPSLLKLATSSQSILPSVGITLEVGHDANKNSNCSVDKAMDELENELKKISPAGNKITVADLARCTMTLNNKIRNRGLSASEIHFARDSHDHSNLALDDSSLSKLQTDICQKNHPRLAISRAPRGKLLTPPAISAGDLVFVKGSDSKHSSLDPHIVLKTNEANKSIVRKTLHSNPNDDRPLAISSKFKLVDNKFLIKPNPFNKSISSNVDNIPTTPSRLLNQPKKIQPLSPLPTTWTPILNHEDQDLIPLLDQSKPQSPDRTQVTPRRLLANTEIRHSSPSPPHYLNVSPHLDSDASRHTIDEQDTPRRLIDTAEIGLPSPNPLNSPSVSPLLDSDDSQRADDEQSLSSDSSSSVRLFNDNEHPDLPERLNQRRRPIAGDRISYYNSTSASWVNAIVTHDLSRRYPDYFNIIREDGQAAGVYLIPETRWTLRSATDHLTPEEPRSVEDISESLRPSPNTPPNQTYLRSFHSDTSLDQTLTSVLDDPCESSESLEWDYSVQPFPSYNIPLHCPVNLDNVLPLPPLMLDPTMERDLHSVLNMERLLPLTSTQCPVPTRVSHQRRLLPLEMEPTRRRLLPTFLSRLPFFRDRS